MTAAPVRQVLTVLVLALLAAPAPIWAQEEDPPEDSPDIFVPQENRIISVTGRVLMEDGGPPPEPVTIERNCSGYSLTEGYTDRKGHFSFQIRSGGELSTGAVRGALPGAGSSGASPEVSSGMRTAAQSNHGFGPGASSELRDCRVEASLPGYRTAAVELNGRDFGEIWKIGALVLKRLANVEGTSISITTLSAPKKARQSFDKAHKELKKKKPNEEKAGHELELAVGEYPEFAAAWNLLGVCRLRRQDRLGARHAFEKSIAIDPKYLEPYLPLIRMAVQDSAWKPANELSNAVLKLNPVVTEARFLCAVSHYGMGQLAEAEQAARMVLQASDSPRFPQNHYLLGTIYENRRDYPAAASHYRLYVASSAPPRATGDVRQRLREWEMLGVIPPESQPQRPDLKLQLLGRLAR